MTQKRRYEKDDKPLYWNRFHDFYINIAEKNNRDMVVENFILLDDSAVKPVKSKSGGYDIFSLSYLRLKPYQIYHVRTGVKINLSKIHDKPNFYAKINNHPTILKQKNPFLVLETTVVNEEILVPCIIIDPTYLLNLQNVIQFYAGNSEYEIKPGSLIAKLTIHQDDYIV